ncbi:Vmc-like lipoprotein signal peptide domain-containing protein [Mycoplasma marinum]|uniref:Lipoprotein n=1 Tax=Mycoplasma marinum TaxID=1937190 RepID=A0A4V2NHZ8_9MOLU|nr:hypothetical protein [Mycoplasma marinum]TCG10838.1 hypothetical protein C4B24_03860 [Mycoplasma marinum]
MKIKKITIGSLAALATIAIPVATVASCGNEEYKKVTLTKKSDLSKVIDMKAMQNHGFNFMNSIEEKTNIQQEKEKVLNHKFVDTLVSEISSVDLTKFHKVIYLDLNWIGDNLDKLGDYFWSEMSKIKVDRKKHEIDDWDGRKTYGSSGIMLNIANTKLGKRMAKEYFINAMDSLDVTYMETWKTNNPAIIAGKELTDLVLKVKSAKSIAVVNLSQTQFMNIYQIKDVGVEIKEETAPPIAHEINGKRYHSTGTWISKKLWEELFGFSTPITLDEADLREMDYNNKHPNYENWVNSHNTSN